MGEKNKVAPIVSIIVPVYQSVATLNRCLDNILSQTLREIEVLLINDGSVDRSGDVCEKYAKIDNRVHVFHKSHSGVSDTRQVGLSHSIGEYVICCDSDDWMELNMLQLLYQKAKNSNADLVVCDYWEEYSKRIIHKEFPRDYDPSIDITDQMYSFSYSVCNKLIRRDFVVQNNLCFLPSICYAEDLYFSLRLLNSNPHIAYLPQPLYHYRQNNESLTHNLSLERLESHKKVLLSLTGCLSDSLNKKLNSNKCRFLYEAFKSKNYSFNDLRKMFPEVHKLILPLVLEHCWRNIFRVLQRWYWSIDRRF